MLRKSVLLFPLLFYSCASFESVTDTAKLAQGLGQQQVTFTFHPCELEFLNIKQLPCAEYMKADVKRKKAIDLFVAYGKVLEKLVKDSELETEDQIDLVLSGANDAGWTSLTDDQVAGAEKIASSIMKILTNGIKRRALSKELNSNNTAVKAILTHLEADLVIRVEHYSQFKNTLAAFYNNNDPTDHPDSRIAMDPTFKTKIGYVADNKLDRITYLYITRLVNNDIKKMEETIKALNVFGVAHKTLADNFKRVGSAKDPEVVAELMKNLADFFEGLEKLKKKQEKEKTTDKP